MVPNLGGQEFVIILIVLALIFGASRLPLLGRNIGRGIKEFKTGISEIRNDNKDEGGKDASADGGPTTSSNGVASVDDTAAKRRD